MRFAATISVGIRMALILTLSAAPVLQAQEFTPEQVDATLDQLLQLDPAQLVSTIANLKEQAIAGEQEAAALRQKAGELEGQATLLGQRVDSLMVHVEALGMRFNPKPEASAEAPAMAQEAAMETAAATFTNYEEHVKPILMAKCARCHNPDKRKSGLSVATFAQLMEGGSSGAVVSAKDPDGSRLLRLIMQTEEPFMPPSGDPLPLEEIDVIRRWIADGALADAGSQPVMTAENTAPEETQGAFVAATFVDGPPPMPETALPEPHRLEQRGVVARAMDTSPRSPLLAVGADRQVLLFDLDKKALLGALPFPEGDIFTLSFSVNGELLYVGGGQEGDVGVCVVWNVRTAERLGEYGQGYDTVLAVDISPDHRMIAVGGPNKKVRVYALEGGAELYTLDAHTDWIQAVKFTPDGEVLATADRAGGLFLWQAANGRFVEQLRGHEGAINALDYTADSVFLASAGNDGTVQIWDTWAYTRVRSFKAYNNPVLYLDVAPDARIVTASSNGVTKLWNIEGAEQKTFDKLKDWGYQVHFSGDAGLVLAGSWTGDIVLWNTETAETVATFNTNPGETPTQLASAAP